MQDHIDPRSFTIVERYAHESSQKYVLSSLLRLLLLFFFTFATREFWLMRLTLFSVCIYLGTISRTRKFFFLSLSLSLRQIHGTLPTLSTR